MDGAHSRRTSSPPQLPATLRENSSVPNLPFEHNIFDSDPSPSRQQRRLNARNARFPAKKLSISGLSSKLSQFIGNTEIVGESNLTLKDQENSKLHKSKSTGTIGKRSSLGILEEISNSSRARSQRRRGDIPIYQDNPERPLLQSSPFVSSPFIDPRGDFTSPIAFDQIHDNLSDMRVRKFSFDAQWSPAQDLPLHAAKSRKRSVPTHFDADDYIEHIEKELQQTRDDAYSPLTRRPMKEKLRAANKENERLQKELAQLREKFETEVKRTVEHKTVTELELKHKVRDLEDLLEEKDHTIRELQYQHEEKRLDSNIINSLKANIERLEQDKIDMEEINLSMSKRNEVLTQLLAMSPTKTGEVFNLGSPGRERRPARPISLILPRHPSPPSVTQYALPNSLICSPRALNSADISPFKLSPDQGSRIQPVDTIERPLSTPQNETCDPLAKLKSPVLQQKSRRSTMYSEASASSSGPNGGTALNSDERAPARRKARRFMGGSTQLKPLLLPTLAGDTVSMPSTSTASSPRSWPTRPPSEADIDETILADEPKERFTGNRMSLSDDVVSQGPNSDAEEGPGPACTGQDGLDFNEIDDNRQSNHCMDTSIENTGSTMHQMDADAAPRSQGGLFATTSSVATLSTEHLRQHDSCYSMQVMPMPSTPESLVSLPQPLFSANRNIATRATDETAFGPSGSPIVAPTDPWQVNISKRRKHSLGTVDLYLPTSKIHRRRQRCHSSADIATNVSLIGAPRNTNVASSIASAESKLRQIRSSDNFIDLLRQKNFAARPLAAMTIRTIYTLLSTCTGAAQEFRRDPFALARRVLANAWRMNWKVFGKLSWWVLGLFVQPQARAKARAPIDWDQYDGESIASRYCGSQSDCDGDDFVLCESNKHVGSGVDADFRDTHDEHRQAASTPQKPGWGHSMLLWGKFSAALVLAVGGAVIKGPGEMLKDMNTTRERRVRHKSCKSCSGMAVKTDMLSHGSPPFRNTQETVSTPQLFDSQQEVLTENAELDIRSQLDSSSLLEHIQQHNDDSTLRPETLGRGRLGDLFSPASSSEWLASRMQDLRLSGSNTELS